MLLLAVAVGASTPRLATAPLSTLIECQCGFASSGLQGGLAHASLGADGNQYLVTPLRLRGGSATEKSGKTLREKGPTKRMKVAEVKSAAVKSRSVRSLTGRLDWQGVSNARHDNDASTAHALDAEIEEIISNQELFDEEGRPGGSEQTRESLVSLLSASVLSASANAAKSDKHGRRLPRPNIMAVFR